MTAPLYIPEILRHLMVIPSHTSPLNPAMVPSFAMNVKPSPLFKVIPFLRGLTVMLSLPVEITSPISSPIDLVASIAAHLPLFPSMKSSV